MSEIQLTPEQRKQSANPTNAPMSIENYAEIVVKRTVNKYPDMNHNNHHMVMGFTSELTDELIKALNANDNTNIVEELGDATFFVVGVMILNGWFDKFIEKIKSTDSLLLNLGFDWTNLEEQAKLSDETKSKMFNGVLFDTFVNVGSLNTIFKNILVKDTPKYDGKILTDEEIVDKLCSLLIQINTISSMTGNSIAIVRNVNNEKLFARYSGGSFDPKKSLERNTVEEQKLMAETIAQQSTQQQVPISDVSIPEIETISDAVVVDSIPESKSEDLK